MAGLLFSPGKLERDCTGKSSFASVLVASESFLRVSGQPFWQPLDAGLTVVGVSIPWFWLLPLLLLLLLLHEADAQ